MHRGWISLPLFTSVVSAFYPYHQGQDDRDNEKRFIPLNPFAHDSQDDLVKIDINKVQHKRDNTFPVVKSNKPSAPNGLAVNQDGADFSYFSSINFGSKGQEMYMLIDTGSANTWVMGQSCASKSCSIHNLFGPADSTTLNVTKNEWSLSYGTGTVSGVVASDTVAFANFTLEMSFGLATVASDDFNNYPMDGILGLGRTTSDELGAPTVMDTLKSQGKLPQNIVGIHLNRGSDSSKDGEIIFGGVDTDKFSGQIGYTKVSNVASWEIPVEDAFVNGSPCGFTNKAAIIDTGTSYVLMPPSDAAKLHSLIPGSATSGETFTVPCSSTANVQVSFSGVKYSISPKDYVGKPTTGSSCNSNIIGHQAFGPNDWILGDVFLKNVYAVFDYDQARIGFGMPGSGGSISGVTASPSTTGSGSSPSSTLATATSGSTSTASSSSSASQSSSAGSGSPFDSDSPSSSSSSSSQKNAAVSTRQGLDLFILIVVAFFVGLIV